MTVCLVPDHGLGPIRPIAVENIDTATVASFLESAGTSLADFSVSLSTTASATQVSQDFDVTFRGSVLGSVPPRDADKYPELQQLIQAGVRPVVTARAEIVGENEVRLTLQLPQPGLCLPSNEPPEDSWAMLADGDLRPVRYDFSALDAPLTGPAHLLVELAFDDADDIEVRLGGRFIGMLNSDDAADLAPALRKLDERGRRAFARGFFDAERRVFTVSAAPRADLGPDNGTPFVATPEQTHDITRPSYRAERDAQAAAFEAETSDYAPPAAKSKSSVPRIAAIVGALILATAGATMIVAQFEGSTANTSSIVESVRSVPAPTVDPAAELPFFRF